MTCENGTTASDMASASATAPGLPAAGCVDVASNALRLAASRTAWSIASLAPGRPSLACSAWNHPASPPKLAVSSSIRRASVTPFAFATA